MAETAAPRASLLFVVNWDWFFLSHRLPVALAARKEGYRVTVATVDTGRGPAIRDEGLDFVPLRFDPHAMRPLGEIRALLELARLYRSIRPDIIHHVTIKPVLYGSIAARAVSSARVVNAVSGLGQMFSDTRRAQALRPVIRTLYRVALGHRRSLTIFQNPDDLAHFVGTGLVDPRRAVIIRGSGVDVDRFPIREEPNGAPVVVFPARLLWEKGIGEFVEAARLVRARHPEVRMVVLGAPDPGNPASVPESTLDEWRTERDVELWGHRDDMPDVLAGAHIVALPTRYPEGVPKALLEAAATGRPIVATDVPGCREVVQHGETGLLVPPADPATLAQAIVRLIEDPASRAEFGRAGRRRVEQHFRVDLVVDETLALYRRLLAGAAGAAGEDALRPPGVSA